MEEVFQRLKDQLYVIQCFQFNANTQLGKNGWEGKGSGKVNVEKSEENVIVFYENGIFVPTSQKTIKCNNVYRWTFEEASIKLEHLRFGAENPVYLFDLVYVENDKFISKCAHLCDKDFYHAELCIYMDKILLDWRIFGAERNEDVRYIYT